MAERKAAHRRSGFALLMVLWVLVLIALILAQLFSAGRTETRMADGLAESAKAEALADGAVYEAIFRMIENARRLAEAVEPAMAVEGGTVLVRVSSEDGKVNPNTVSPQIMAALLMAIGVESGHALRLASAIADWHEAGDKPRPLGAKLGQYAAAGLDHSPPNAAFESLDELGRVLGMTPVILTALRPHLTLYSLGDPDPRFADPTVVQLLRPFAKTLVHSSGTSSLVTVTMEAEARMASGVTFTRHAIIRLSPSFVRGYAILSWD